MAATINLEQLRDYMRRQSEEDKKNRTLTLEAQSVDEALKRASIELATPVRNLEYEVLEKGSAGTFGVGRRPWKVHVYEKSRRARTSVEVAEEERSHAEAASQEPQKPKDLPGEVFVRIGSDGAQSIDASRRRRRRREQRDGAREVHVRLPAAEDREACRRRHVLIVGKDDGRRLRRREVHGVARVVDECHVALARLFDAGHTYDVDVVDVVDVHRAAAGALQAALQPVGEIAKLHQRVR